MKKIFLLLMLLSIPLVVSAGEIRKLPQAIVITKNTAEDAELLDLRFVYGTRPYAEIRFNILDDDGNVVRRHTARIQNIPDNDDTPEDESTTDFTNFVAGYASIMATRSDQKVWQYINANYNLQ